ncbi:MAG: RsmB/NOP family class I SAM-dependent RNA methyltransferase [candidate division WOR-3 bacterium]
MVRLSRRFPREFITRYGQFIPDFDSFLDAMCRPLKRTIRVNTIKATREEVCELLADAGLEPLPWCDIAFSVNNGAGLGRRLAHFLGLFYIQEAASMVPPLVLGPRPGERVLDIAAAPGSKTTQMAAMMENTGLLIANDPSPQRIRGLIGNIDRAGCLNVAVCRMGGVSLAKLIAGSCDRVLVDAPCSSEGTIRKSNEALARWSVRAIERFSRLQQGLICAGFQALRPGGMMVYSTCTVAPEENEGVVAHLLSRHPDAEVVEVELPGLVTRPALTEWSGTVFPEGVSRCRRILPQDNDTEAFFVALIKKRDERPPQGS